MVVRWRGFDQLPQMIVAILACLSLSLVSGGLLASATQCQGNQSALLLELKRGLNFNTSLATKLPDWGSTSNCCHWRGVSCDNDGLGNVIGLDLSNKSISILDNSSPIFKLSHLQNLNLAYNNFNSPIPSEIGNLKALVHLNLSNAKLIDQVPGQLSELVGLEVLDLSVSSLLSSHAVVFAKPTLREVIGKMKNMKELYFDGIDMSRDVGDWGEVLSSSLPNLEVLSMENCRLDGPIPDSLRNLRSLTRINLNQNSLASAVPSFFGTFSSLEELSMASCQLEGEFPQSVFTLPRLESLDLSSNLRLNIRFPEFSQYQPLRQLILPNTPVVGGLPQSLGFLKNIARLDMQNCNMTGIIPESLSNVENLLYLDLSLNNLEGSLPRLSKSTNLKYLSVSNNQLSGNISDDHFKGMDLLNSVDLKNNSLNGSIPTSLFSIPNLQLIECSYNRFSGPIPTIPPQLGLQIKTLGLSTNRLSGQIPGWIFSLDNLAVLDLSFNSLSGEVELDSIKKLQNITSLNLSNNILTVVADRMNEESPFPQLSKLSMASCNLSVFPQLGNQSKLTYLDLSLNKIPEVLPWLLTSVHTLTFVNLSFNELVALPPPSLFVSLLLLDVHNNKLNRNIPTLPSTTIFADFSNNNLSSTLPEITGVVLVFFSAANNRLYGRIPNSFCNCSSLKLLDLSNNSFIGNIPDCLFKLERLGVLSLKSNRLTGEIPDGFTEACRLETLALNGNLIRGKVPESLENCSSLEVLDLGNNLLEGTFPCAINASLRVLILRNNSFYGEIGCPPGKGDWALLQIVDISSNNFSGTLPEKTMQSWNAMMVGRNGTFADRVKFRSINAVYYVDSIAVIYKGQNVELTKILTVFTAIDFSLNRFEGQMPEAIAKFRTLYLLNLSHNSFSGPILSGIGQLCQLESLDLSVNSFSGTIPQSIAELSFLSFLNLSYNMLAGRLPISPQLLTFGESSYENNLGLCGPPLPTKCDDGNSVPRNSSSQSDSKLSLRWDYIFPGMGVGMGLASVLAPVFFSETVNRWFDDCVDRMLEALLPLFGFLYIKKRDRNYDDGDDGSTSDSEDDVRPDEFSATVMYCVKCAKLDNAMTRVVHDPKCACYLSPNSFSSSSFCLSSDSG